MAKTVFEIDIETAGAVSSAKDLREQFNILEDKMFELAAAGKEGTKEFAAIRNQLAGTKERIDDLNESIDMLKPEAKFQAFANLGAGIASGFAAAQGAAQLFGSESEALNESLAKVQAAMALAQGVQGLAGMGDSLKVVGTMLKSTTIGTQIATAAQKVYNAVMNANPIAKIIAGLTALVGIIALVVNAMEDENEEQKKVIAARERELEVMDSQMSKFKEEADFRRQLASAMGKSAEDILKQNKALNEQESKLLSDRIQQLRRNIYARIELFKTSNEDEIKELQKKNDEDFKIIAESSKRQRDLLRTNNLEQAKFNEEQRKKAEEKAKEDEAKAKERAAKKLADDIANAEKWRQEQAKFIQYEIDALNNKFGEAEQIIAEQQLATKIQLGTATPDEIEAWNAYKLKQEVDYQTALDTELKRLTDEQNKRREEQNAKIQAEFDAEKKRREDEQAMRKRNAEFAVQATQDSLSAISELTDSFAGQSVEEQKKAFNIKKAVSIAQATIDTYLAAQGAFASQQVPGDPTSPIRGAIAAGLAIASGLARVAVIAKQQFQAPSTGGGAGGGGGAIGTITQGGGQPPQGLTAQNTVTQLNPDGTVAGQGNREAQPVKAYVVESESRAVTERVNKLSNQSKI